MNPLTSSLPWLALPLIGLARSRSRALAEEPAEPPANAPRVSVVIPARNEARNIDRCVRSMLTSTWPALEVLVVNDHSTDDTAAVARSAGIGDARLRVMENPDLPAGWMGKQWACWNGARAATGEIILFLDADTWSAPDLVTRTVSAMRSRAVTLLSVAGWQELGTIWEKLVQPQIFSILFVRYGGTETMNRATRASDVIANGQCLMVERAAYEAVGGHERVRNCVAEDLMLAQEFFRAGRRPMVVVGLEQLRTRMYQSLDELIKGWGKNVYAGGRESAPGGRIGRALYPLMLLSVPLGALVPPVIAMLSIFSLVPSDWALWSWITSSLLLAWWMLIYRFLRESAWLAFLYPLGALLLLWITVRAIAHGKQVAWKDREYTAA
ncbi:MAG: glycosyl transferase family 2 [Gemmatimonadetes bacterium]|nr:glycosyl transferase family 2 [Gemmatimonadota bacterium]